jgi:hypothetical protein
MSKNRGFNQLLLQQLKRLSAGKVKIERNIPPGQPV